MQPLDKLPKKFQMQQNFANIPELTQGYSTQAACLEELNQYQNGFLYPKCAHNRACRLKHDNLRESTKYGRQVSPMAKMIFDHTRLPLPKWFGVIDLMKDVQAGSSAERLSKTIGETWSNAHRMPEKLRQTVDIRGQGYWLEGVVKIDNAVFGGHKLGKIGCKADGKKPVSISVEHRDNHKGFIAAYLVGQESSARIHEFTKYISSLSKVHTDAFPALSELIQSNRRKPNATPPKIVDEWYTKVHIVISNIENFLMESSMKDRIHTLRNKLISLFITSINDSWNLNCPIFFCKPQLFVCQLGRSVFTEKSMQVNISAHLHTPTVNIILNKSNSV